jgi:hypothetical protein
MGCLAPYELAAFEQCVGSDATKQGDFAVPQLSFGACCCFLESLSYRLGLLGFVGGLCKH